MRSLAFVGVLAAALMLAGTASGKGPGAATIDGPGTGGGISVGGGPGNGERLHNLADGAGFFPAVFRQTPDPMLPERPRGELGPRYTITYRVPGPNNEEWILRQDLYPYAESGPVTYMKPGQPVFETEGTRGGWYQGDPSFRATLVKIGLPASKGGATAAPKPTPAPAASDDGGTSLGDLWPAIGVAFALGLTAAVSLLVRRRERTATP